MSSIRKRGNRWEVRIRRGRSGSALCKSFLLRQDAVIWARSMELEIDKGQLPHSSREQTRQLTTTPFFALLIRYRDEVTPRKKGHETERIVLNAFLRHPISSMPLSQLTKATFAAYRDERLKEVKPATLKRQFAILSHVFKVAMEEWSIPIPVNPTKGLHIPGILDNRRQRRLQGDEEQRLIEAVGKLRNRHIRAAILLALHTGMRRSEILNVKKGDLVGGGAGQGTSSGRLLRIHQTKTGIPRTIPLSSQARSIVMALVADETNTDHEEEPLFLVSANALRLARVRVTKTV